MKSDAGDDDDEDDANDASGSDALRCRRRTWWRTRVLENVVEAPDRLLPEIDG